MKNFRKGLLVLFLCAIVIHAWVWLMNRGIHEELLAQNRENEAREIKTIKEIRIELETEQRKEIESYGWTEKEKGIARIPVERAAFYYLRSLPRD